MSRIDRKSWLVLAAGVACLVLAFIMAMSGSVHAADVERVRETQPASCNGQRCVQLRTVTVYSHGQGTLVIHKRRTAPAESRTPTDVHPWRPWRVVGAVVIPCCGGVR
jgi:hypothetical protein